MTGVELLRLLRERGWYVRIGPDRRLRADEIWIYPWNTLGDRTLKLKSYLRELGLQGELGRIAEEMLEILKVRPCPQCGNPAYSWGPEGIPQRRCHGCKFVWMPELEEAS